MNNERRLLLAIVLSTLVIWVYQVRFAPKPEDPSTNPPPARPAQAEVSSTPAAAPPTPPVPGTATETVPGAAPAGVAPDAPPWTGRFTRGGWEARFTNQGDGPVDWTLSGYSTPTASPSILSWLRECVGGSCGPSPLACPDLAAMDLLNREVGSAIRVWLADPARAEGTPAPARVEETADGLRFTRNTPQGLQVETTWQWPKGEGQAARNPSIAVSARLSNPTAASVTLEPYIGVADVVDHADAGQYDLVRSPAGVVGGDLETYTLSKLDKKRRLDAPGPVSWVGMGDNYFLTAVVPLGTTRPDGMAAGVVGSTTTAGPPGSAQEYFTAAHYPAVTLKPGESETLTFSAFLGPKVLDLLNRQGGELNQAVDFGFFAAFARPLLWLLRTLHRYVDNWGLAIILLTVIVKLAVFPLDQRSYKSMKAMQKLQPHMKEVQERNKDDREKMNLEMIQLYREHGVNPLGGCLPILVQMPVWLALYRVLWHSIELYHSRFLYFCDLTQRDPIGLLPLLLVGAMVLQQRMTPMPAGQDPAQAAVLRWMPVIFGVMMFPMPAGLVLYIFVSTLLRMGQQWMVQRAPDARAVPT